MQKFKNPDHVSDPVHAHSSPTPVQLVDLGQWADQAPMLEQMVVDHQELHFE